MSNQPSPTRSSKSMYSFRWTFENMRQNLWGQDMSGHVLIVVPTTNATYHQLGIRTSPSFPQSRSRTLCVLSHSYRWIRKNPAITVAVFPPGQVLATWHAIWDQSVDTRSGGHLQWQVPSSELRKRELEVNAQVKNKLRSQDKEILRYDTSWLHVIMNIYYE